MKTKILKIAAFLLISGTVLSSCKDPDDGFSLRGTQWKLVGAVDTETDSLRKFGPADCEECYTLLFHSGHKATVQSITETLQLDLLNLDPDRPVQTILMGEWYNGTVNWECADFREAIILTASYTASPEELKLYYYHNHYYLSFKPF